MGRVICLDYGQVRTGIAHTDDAKMIASPLETVKTVDLLDFLKGYFSKYKVDELVIGHPMHLDGRATDATPLVMKFIEVLKK